MTTEQIELGKQERTKEKRMGRLALCQGEGEGEDFPGQIALGNVKTPHLTPLPFTKGRGGRREHSARLQR